MPYPIPRIAAAANSIPLILNLLKDARPIPRIDTAAANPIPLILNLLKDALSAPQGNCILILGGQRYRIAQNAGRRLRR